MRSTSTRRGPATDQLDPLPAASEPGLMGSGDSRTLRAERSRGAGAPRNANDAPGHRSRSPINWKFVPLARARRLQSELRMSPLAIDPQQTLAHLVLDHSECAEVLQRYRLDFCCRGEVSIEAAATARGVDLVALLGELSRAIAQRHDEPSVDARCLSTPELIAHITSKHHEYLRLTLPVVTSLASKVSRVHGERNPRLRSLDASVRQLAEQLIPHLDEEESVLFPALVAPNPARPVAPLLAAMLAEHRGVAQLLEQIREASDQLTPPAWACNSYRTLLSELSRLETDTFAHVHLENHILLPRFSANPS